MHDEAAELYRRATGTDLSVNGDLAEVLRLGDNGKWAVPRYEPSFMGRDALDARVLAGLFLLDETVIWSTCRRLTLRIAFQRMRNLVEGSPDLRQRVRRIFAANGCERIDMVDGHALVFVTRPHGARGYSGDFLIVDEFDPVGSDVEAMLPSLLASANPQMVLAY